MGLLQTQEQRDLLADALGDTPETAIANHLLRRGLADAYAADASGRLDGMVVQSHLLRREPWCFGTDPSAIWELLRPLNDWRQPGMSPNASADLAGPLAALMEQDAGVHVRRYGDVYHTLTGDVAEFAVPEVRQLELEDVDLLAAYRRSAQGMSFVTFEDLLTNGAAAGAVVEGGLVALAHTNALTAKHGDIGVATDESWRGKGFASACGNIVARLIRERGRIPVWSAGEDNAASLRIAAKLGFLEVSRRYYLNTDRRG